MATPSRLDQLLQLTEVIWTAASFAVFFLQAVASTDRTKELSFNAAVESTDDSFCPPGSLLAV